MLIDIQSKALHLNINCSSWKCKFCSILIHSLQFNKRTSIDVFLRKSPGFTLLIIIWPVSQSVKYFSLHITTAFKITNWIEWNTSSSSYDIKLDNYSGTSIEGLHHSVKLTLKINMIPKMLMLHAYIEMLEILVKKFLSRT